ncbi:hypothetical protein DL98DRAFT_659121 [Cadophora sp. DSE1049]|nr:hypothetical protein DL98DRAFT_659121 [Cadophora sp. DSE1049]
MAPRLAGGNSASLKTGLEEYYGLLASIEPGSTLVMSSPRRESIEGYITKMGTRIVKGCNPSSSSSSTPFTTLRSILNQSLDLIDIILWKGDRHSAAPNSTSYTPSFTKLPQSSRVPTSSHFYKNNLPLRNRILKTSLPYKPSLHLTILESMLLLTVRVLE